MIRVHRSARACTLAFGAIVFAGVVLSGPGAQAEILYASPFLSTSVQGRALQVATSDLNGDGKSDLAVH